ncbi:glycoside hydrolase family 5 protein [Atractiella rhizophila]|nr:glycoside hydrolase family 5 protein [Atractiella rhizophila]
MLKSLFLSLPLLFSPLAIAASSGLPRLGGINLAGMEFGIDIWGNVNGQAVDPPQDQITHFISKGANVIRFPLGWQYIQPTLGGALNSAYLKRYDALVQKALKSDSSARVIIDVHNYARVNSGVIGQGGPTDAQFVDLWKRLAKKYGGSKRVIFGLMNEPHDLNIETWAKTLQKVVTGIRSTGAVNILLLPGTDFSSLGSFPNYYPYLKGIKDSDGSKDKLIFDVHTYLDSDSSGTHTETTELQQTLKILKTDKRQAILSEVGGGNTSSCKSKLKLTLSKVKSAYPHFVGFTTWAAGSFSTSYELSLVPTNGKDNALFTAAVKPNLP